MRNENLNELGHYITTYVGTKSTRHVSEDLFECPPVTEAVAGERNMRLTLHAVYDAAEEANGPRVINPEDATLDDLSARYWNLAQYVTDAHGANPDYTLDDYFHTRQKRNYEDLKQAALEGRTADSVTSLLFAGIEAYRDDLSLDTVDATRLLFNLFSRELPSMKVAAHELSGDGLNQSEASRRVIGDFAVHAVGRHVAQLRHLADSGTDIHTSIEKSFIYPEDSTASEQRGDPPLKLSLEDAEGMMSTYHIREYPYEKAELALGEEIIRLPAMQKSLLAFQLGMIQEVAKYLALHPERGVTGIAPFSEIFIAVEGIEELVPNPHLLKVIANNIMPAIARLMIQNGAKIEDMDPRYIAVGVDLAKRLKVFQTKIGEFNNFNPADGTVELSSMFTRTCPANHFISSELAKHLPGLYDSYSREHS